MCSVSVTIKSLLRLYINSFVTIQRKKRLSLLFYVVKFLCKKLDQNIFNYMPLLKKKFIYCRVTVEYNTKVLSFQMDWEPTNFGTIYLFEMYNPLCSK